VDLFETSEDFQSFCSSSNITVVTFRRVNLHHYWRTNGSCIIEDQFVVSFGWSQGDNRLPPHTLMMDVTVTHDRYRSTTQCTNGITHTECPQQELLSLTVL
jgi:hypothetical protein